LGFLYLSENNNLFLGKKIIIFFEEKENNLFSEKETINQSK
jgi:hypothetical protein